MSTVTMEVMRSIEQMDDNNARAIYDWLSTRFQVPSTQISWGNIEEEEPDEIDRVMLNQIATDRDCNEFISEGMLLEKLS